jgi:hypothetical protein
MGVLDELHLNIKRVDSARVRLVTWPPKRLACFAGQPAERVTVFLEQSTTPYLPNSLWFFLLQLARAIALICTHVARRTRSAL